jgi:hypothetical protein
MTFGLPPPKNVKNLFGNWLAGIDKRSDMSSKFELGCVLLSGLSGMHEMIKFLTKQELHLFCRLYRWLPIGSVCGPICNQWRFERPWILGATVWRRSHGSYSANSVGGMIIELRHVEL